MVWAEIGGGGRDKPQLKIPEQRMKEEVANIEPSLKADCELALRRMKFKTTPRNILAMHRIHTSSEEIAHMISYYLFKETLPSLSSQGVIKNSENLEKFADGLGAYYKTISNSGLTQDDAGMIADNTISQGLLVFCKEGKIKDVDQALAYIREISDLYDSMIKTGENGRFLQVPLFHRTLPSIAKSNAVNTPEELAKSKEQLEIEADGDAERGKKLLEKYVRLDAEEKKAIAKLEDIPKVVLLEYPELPAEK